MIRNCQWNIFTFLDAVNSGYREQAKAHNVSWVTWVPNNILKKISYETLFSMSNEIRLVLVTHVNGNTV